MKKKIFLKAKQIFITGLIGLIPIVVTIYAIYLLFITLDNFLKEIIYKIIGQNIPGIGILALFIIIFMTGFIITTMLGKKLLVISETIMTKIPLIKNIYFATKEVTQVFSSGKNKFLKTVLVEYPRKGLYAIGFVTYPSLKIHEEIASSMVCVFIPTTPNPTSGILLIVPEKEIISLSISVEESIRLVISGGIVVPDKLKFKI